MSPKFAVPLLLAAVGLAQSRPSVRVQEDVPYLGPARAENADVYSVAPATAGERRPGIVIIHGGGWHKGDKRGSRQQNIGRTLARAGYVCVSINYTLGGDLRPIPWPQNVHDCKNAVRFLRHNAERYGVDPDRIGVIGASAGAHLASMVGVTGPVVGLEPETPYPGVSSSVSAVVDLYGPVSFLTRQQTDARGRPTGEPKDGPIPILLGGTRDECRELWEFASPVTHVTKGDPPFLIVHGKADTTVDYLQSKTLAERLERAGVACELILLEGVGHAFDLRQWNGAPLPKWFAPRVVAFFDQHLKPLTARLDEGAFGSGDVQLPYRLFTPRASRDVAEGLPLVLFLHGAGERGDDNAAQLKWGVHRFVAGASQHVRPCFVVAPQCPTGSGWIKDGYDLRCIELVESLVERLPIDPDRIYVTGLSMGGHGTWRLAANRPEMFAAAVPICGGGDASTAVRLARVPIWAFHGDADRVVEPERSRAMIRAVEKAGGSPRYTEYPEVGHNSWSTAYADSAMHEWLFAQRRSR